MVLQILGFMRREWGIYADLICAWSGVENDGLFVVYLHHTEESGLEINDELYLFVIDPMAERVLTAN
jgi:hypothetical protein